MQDKMNVTPESKEIKVLMEHDPNLRQLINLIGEVSITLRKDHLRSLVHSIIGQQLSVKAASTIISRFHELVDHQVNLEKIFVLRDEDLRSVGISGRKVMYIRDLCEKVKTGLLTLDYIDHLPDEEVISQLTKVKGIGRWTAEMFLIFSLGRKNILSLDDVGLQRALKWVMSADKDQNGKALLASKNEVWSPHCSLASLYLWEAVNLGYVDKYFSLQQAVNENRI